MNDLVNRVDVISIMEEIRLGNSVSNFEQSNIRFEDIPIHRKANDSHIQCSTSYLESLYNSKNVLSYRILTSHRKVGKIIIFIKKIIRKCTKFYVEPIVCDQNHYNQMVFESISTITKEMDILKESILKLQLECTENQLTSVEREEV